MAVDDLGLTVPLPTDMFNPDGDIRTVASSTAGRIIVPVTNTTERDALADTLSPSAAIPLYVHRSDAAEYARTEWTEDGTTWHPVISGDTGWGTSTSGFSAASGFSLDSIDFRVIGPMVSLVFAVIRTGSDIGPASSGNISNTALLNLPPSLTPAVSNGTFGPVFTGVVKSAIAFSVGNIYCTTVAPGYGIATDDRVDMTGVYFL